MTQSLDVGMAAPPFRLMGSDGRYVDSGDLRGRPLALFFYPKANTPGCSREAADFQRLRPRFHAANAEILGVSADPVRTLERFRAEQGLTFLLASDPDLETLRAYGVWGEKQLYGRKFMGIVRSTFLIDAAGTIIRVWRSVRVPGHAEAVLVVAESLYRGTPV